MGLTNNLGRLSDALTTDASLNVGLGVTPSAWASNLKVFQAASGAFFGYNNGAAISSNAFFDGSWKYINNAFATYYEQNSGQHWWSTAPIGTVGAALTFTQAMTLNASGRLLLGTTTDAGELLQVNGTGRFSGNVTAGGNLGGTGDYTALTLRNQANGDYYVGLDFSSGTDNGTSSIRSYRTNSAVDYQTALTFWTKGTGGGPTSPTERMRITSGGILRLNRQATYATMTYENTIQYYTSPAGIWFGNSGNANNNVALQLRTSNDGASVQAMTITSTGDVAIGSTSVSAFSRTLKINTNTGGTVGLLLTDADNDRAGLYADGGTTSPAYLFTNNSKPLVFSVAGAERARITSAGDILFGKTASAVGGNGFWILNTVVEKGQVFSSITNAANSYHLWDTTNSVYRFYVTGGGTINATSTTIASLSDERLKENIKDLDVGLDAIMSLRPRIYDWKKESGNIDKNVRGFIAQEVESIFPDLIGEWKINPNDENKTIYKSLKQDFIPIIIKAIQEQQEAIQQLSAEIETLKNK